MKSPIQIKNNQIVISKSFAKNAYCFGTPEYEMLQTVRRDYPEFKVVLREIKKNTNVDHYKGLNYEYMKWYIGQYETQEKKDLMLKALDELIDISKCHSTGKRYATMDLLVSTLMMSIFTVPSPWPPYTLAKPSHSTPQVSPDFTSSHAQLAVLTYPSG